MRLILAAVRSGEGSSTHLAPNSLMTFRGRSTVTQYSKPIMIDSLQWSAEVRVYGTGVTRCPKREFGSQNTKRSISSCTPLYCSNNP